ncbi:hypothetical protein Tco_0265342 [Tanacetum coccineum]
MPLYGRCPTTLLERPTDSDDFTEIVDFLNANPIRYALIVSPTIYVSCIEQFWSTAKAQTINEETQIHALVDGKKIVITESSVRRDLQFADEDGTDCLPTTTIFENLKLMGYENLSDKLTFFKSYFSHQWKFLVHTILQCLSPKKTAWNEFSSNIASAIICLATNQKFNFSKMVFDGMTRNLDSLSAKFLMYPRFLQVFLDKQLDKVPSHNPVYNAPCHTKKVFANMKRIGKDFSGKVTPLFDTMLIQHQSEVGDSLERAATTASSLEAEHVSGNITKTRSKATLNEPTPQGTGSGSGPRRQDTMGDTIARTSFASDNVVSQNSIHRADLENIDGPIVEPNFDNPERVPPQNADLLTGEGKFISRISLSLLRTKNKRWFLFPIFTLAKFIVGGICTPKVLPLIASQVTTNSELCILKEVFPIEALTNVDSKIKISDME